MSKAGTAALLTAAVVSLVFLAGFFHAETSAKPAAPRPAEAVTGNYRESADREDQRVRSSMPPPPAARGLMAMTQSPLYRRAADMTLRVADCTKAEDELETKLQKIHGEILDMVMEGTAGSRTCTLSVVIPADQFREFINGLRGMGTVQSERITASKLKPGQADKVAAVEGADPRELSLVAIKMADEKVAQNVLESRGVLASSFDRSASHFMKGLAVIVELVGLVLPFVIGFLALAAPLLVVKWLRRARPASV